MMTGMAVRMSLDLGLHLVSGISLFKYKKQPKR